ncbi:type II toxin-antitoxin system RelE/ParE family toxin [Flavisolibacter nicotianae]|uniref:type II toxin-antitoxin system RelE/ParE family toxin n=1 Tax=Flavisolibacter nicotianae TaxID=2364882 RepID=UPI000EB2144E|nr:type II toxin-antitoxin system RelE/ParE family toxin [Flavisolibacter nicotianae]
MARYLLTNKAVEDLSKIWEHTYEVWLDSQADKYYELLTSSFQDLVQNPALGKNYDEIDQAILGLPVGKHIVFYRGVKSSDIEIVRILHQRMDLKSRMDE